jgi:hypothetical protein
MRAGSDEVKDRFGIPVLRFHWQWSDHEINQVRHMQETFRALIEQMGGTVFSPMPTREHGYGIATGRSHHPRARRRADGRRPGTSVLNGWCQAHDVPQESVRRRWRPVRVAGGQEPDVDDHGARLARERLHHGTA